MTPPRFRQVVPAAGPAVAPRALALSLAVLLAAATLLACPSPARSAVTADQVKIAINKARNYIKSTQKADGSWQDFGHKGGFTALNALALLAAGAPESDPAVQKAIKSLNATENQHTYVVSLKAMVYRYADPKKYHAELNKAAQWLVEAQLSSGTWGYTKMGANRSYVGDNSNTQFGLLGLHEAANGGVKIPLEVWKRSEQHFLKTQNRDGGWAYRDMGGRAGSYGSMTCAGIASLYITGNQLDVSQESGYLNGAARNCGNYRQNDAIAKGLLWMARNFAVDTNPGGAASWRLYYLYAMERVGMISGLKFFGARDWYREGAELLVDSQLDNGSWPGSPYDTAFALLFLAKGNKPVLINKLQWARNNDWCQDRNDVEHLVGFANSATQGADRFAEQPAGWQVVNLRAPLVDLLDAPILYFNGHNFPEFSKAECDKLREFVDQGGTILVEACCSRPEFAAGFDRFARQVWPDYAVERLDDNHPIFSSFYPINKNDWDLRGIQVGCRTSVIFSPKDLSCLWEQWDAKLPATEPAFQLGVNIAAYATGLERLKEKLERARVAENPDAPGRPGDIVRGALHIAALAHSASPAENMPDPNALPKFAEFLRDQAKIDVVTKLAMVEPTDAELLNHPIMFMTGHAGFTYTDEQVAAVRTWLDRGGFLYANACCGRDSHAFGLPGDPAVDPDKTFGDSFRKLAARLYPDQPMRQLPADHPIRGGSAGFFPVAQVTYRPELQKKLLAAKPAAAHELRLEGVTVNGRLAIVYSPYAMTCGLEDHKCFGCRGLVSKDAYRVSTNVILYALTH